MDKTKWIILTYTLPKEPSRPRVAIWRALKKAGAVNLQQSIWVLPDTENHRLTFRKICLNIDENGGETLVMEGVFYEEEHENRVKALFRQMRDEEYAEFIDECGKYLAEIRKEIDTEKFTFAELEEEEGEFEKLSAWHAKIAARDLFGASLREQADDSLKRIGSAFDGFSQKVYEHETAG